MKTNFTNNSQYNSHYQANAETSPRNSAATLKAGGPAAPLVVLIDELKSRAKQEHKKLTNRSYSSNNLNSMAIPTSLQGNYYSPNGPTATTETTNYNYEYLQPIGSNRLPHSTSHHQFYYSNNYPQIVIPGTPNTYAMYSDMEYHRGIPPNTAETNFTQQTNTLSNSSLINIEQSKKDVKLSINSQNPYSHYNRVIISENRKKDYKSDPQKAKKTLLPGQKLLDVIEGKPIKPLPKPIMDDTITINDHDETCGNSEEKEDAKSACSVPISVSSASSSSSSFKSLKSFFSKKTSKSS